MNRILNIILLLVIGFSSCKKDESVSEETVVKKDPISANRIAWDKSSLQRLVNPNGYASYARMIELSNGDFMCVYEEDGNIEMIRSTNKAKTWSNPMRIATNKDNVFMAVPDIVQLTTGEIIISYNPRPGKPFTEDRHFGIATIISKDNGVTWRNDKVIYEAGITFETGCWEPYILELPNGELQLYFANEADYNTHEQNISMFRSTDKGVSWGEREIVSFSPSSRDGMPVSLYLEESDEIIMAIEDNFAYNFKPAIIRTNNDWKNAPVGRNTPDRVYALDHDQRTPTYQGAPYLRKLPSGNIVLGYQGTDGEINHDMSNAQLCVEVGDETGRNFSSNTKPFNVPSGKSGLWNSLSVMDGKVWGVSATNAYSNKSEIWTIAGYEITEYKVPSGEIVDTDEKYPFFVGHKGSTNVGVRLGSDTDNLYLKATVKDASVFDSDAVTFCIDPQNISSELPAKGIYSFMVNAKGGIISKEGKNQSWTNLDFKPQNLEVNKTTEGYEIELTIAWESIGGKPNVNERIGFSISLAEYKTESRIDYSEQLTMSDWDKPYTWATIKL